MKISFLLFAKFKDYLLQNDVNLIHEIEAVLGKQLEKFECKENEVLDNITKVRQTPFFSPFWRCLVNLKCLGYIIICQFHVLNTLNYMCWVLLCNEYPTGLEVCVAWLKIFWNACIEFLDAMCTQQA